MTRRRSEVGLGSALCAAAFVASGCVGMGKIVGESIPEEPEVVAAGGSPGSQIPFMPGGMMPDPGGPGGAGGSGGPVAMACDPTVKASTPPRLRRLTALQWSNTVKQLGATPSAAGVNPFDDGLTSGRFTSDVTNIGLPDKTLTLLLDSAESLSVAILPKLKARFACLSATPLTQACVEGAFKDFGAAAFRRPLTAEEATRYAGFAVGQQASEGADGALSLALAAFFSAPSFAFRWERGDAASAPDAAGRIKLTPYEVASAISYTLTDAPPDATLLAAAAAGQLATPEQISAHVGRLLGATSEPVARFFREYFRYPLAKSVFKDQKLFPNHHGDLLVDDTDLFIQQAVGQRKSFLETLLSSPRAMVRADTASSYGVTVTSKTPVMMDMPSGQRAGLLTQPSFLVAFSDAEASQPIARGKMVINDLLCQELTFPTNAVPPLLKTPDMTVREKLVVHRQPSCAACHSFLDPIALALERYNHAGQYRTTAEGGKPVDPSSELLGAAEEDGPFSGPIELAAKLARSSVVKACFVSQSFRYWLGRSERAADACVLRDAADAYTNGQGDAVALFTSLLTSDAFLYRSGP